MNLDNQRGWKRPIADWAPRMALVLTLGMAGCDSLLDVELPDAVTSSALDDPATAVLQVNSIMAGFECAYSSFAIDAAGLEDNFQRISGVATAYSEYRSTPGGGACDTGSFSSAWANTMLTVRGSGYDYYNRISNFSDADVPNRQKLLGQLAIYNAAILDVFGEHYCEFAIDSGPLLTPVQTLDVAESWADSAFAKIAGTGDYPISVLQGTITTSAQTMTYGLRSRIRWAKGDLAGAAADAAMVPAGFVAWVLREDGEDRRNMVSSMQSGGGGVDAAGFLQGPVKVKTATNDYGVSILGNNPVTGQPWPDPVPFTGYLNLAIDPATGLTLLPGNNPVTTTNTAGAVADTRVPFTFDTGISRFIPQKYPNLSDDIPLINWVEMRLIQAQYQNETVGSQAAAIALINEVRTAVSLPTISVTGSQEAVKNWIIEERRRALFEEGRFWSTKIQNTDRLWFPRRLGDWVNQAQYALNGGVRVLMPNDEYAINPNLSLADRGTGCAPSQAPIF